MCEGKFLVKTNVTTDNVIRQVTVENFRFGIRVIKKPEGRWICQDLNKNTPEEERCNRTGLLQAPIEKDDHKKEEGQKGAEETIVGHSNSYNNNGIKEYIRVQKSGNNSLSSELSEKLSAATLTTVSSNTTIITESKTTCSSIQGPGLSAGSVLQVEIAEQKKQRSETRFNKQDAPSLPVSDHKKFFKGQDIFQNFSSFDFRVKRQRSFNSYRGHANNPNSILYERLRSRSPFTLVPPTKLIPHTTATTAVLTAGQLKKEDKNSTTSGFVRSVERHHHHHHQSSNATEERLKNQYLSKVLGSSPLLKLQLLNLTTVPLNDQEKVPDLLPVETITRLRMLFDDDGSEKTEGGVNNKSEKEPKRMREPDDVQLDISKKVKVEQEDDGGNLVIDENTGFGEELSENSEESNDDGNRADGDPLLEGEQNSQPGDATGKRSNSAASTESNKSCKKNGLDTGVTRVPKLPCNQNSANINNDDHGSSNNSNNNSSSSNDSVSKVLRLEKEITALTSLLKVKEAEWNAVVRLKKLKELAVEYLRREKEVEKELEDESIAEHEEYLKKLMDRIGEESGKIGPDEADVRLNIDKTEKEIKETEKKLKNRGSVNATSKDKSRDSKQADMDNFKASLALQQLCERNRSTMAQPNSPVHFNSNNTNIQNKVIGEGRQGTIVEVRSIIADYRSKNPEDSPQQTELRRRSTQKKSTTTQPRSSASSIISQNQNVSFKDILVNLAKLSESEKAGTSTSIENAVAAPRGPSKNSNSMNVQGNSFGSQRGQVGTTLAKLLSSNSTSNVSVGVIHPDDDNSASSLKIESVNNTNDGNLSLANLLASSKCRDDDIKAEDDDLVPICQGCNTNRAQFVCAGCGNQWYCCRECQIQAWEDHSEICSG